MGERRRKLPDSEALSIPSAMHPKRNGAGKKVNQMYTIFDVMRMGYVEVSRY